MDEFDDALVDPALVAPPHNPDEPMPGFPAPRPAVSDEDDPIIASFNILVKPSLPAHRKVMILEHPTKSDGRRPERPPLEFRHKAATGMVEVDFPIDFNSSYDRVKGLNWGTNLHKSTEAKKGGSHGLAGGFGVGAPPPRARAGRSEEIMDLGMDWNEALRKDFVLRTQTLGGQTPDAGAESKYMVGVFAGSNLHLTPATSLIHLRPQLHHLDATTEQERLSRGGGGPGGAAGGATKEAARAIHMTIKQTKDGDEEIVQETMADRLKKVQMEGWRRHRYVHDESGDSWAVSEEALFLRPRVGAGSGVAVGTQAEEEGAGTTNEHGVAELAEQVARLRTGWDEDGMLETTSGIQKDRTAKVELSDDEPAGLAAPAKGKGKGKAADTATTSKPAGRGKTTASASSKAIATTRGKRATTTITTTTTTTEVAGAGPSSRAKKND